jgi:hypothetical protein
MTSTTMLPLPLTNSRSSGFKLQRPATDEQTTEQLAATPEPAAPKIADGNCGNSNCGD